MTDLRTAAQQALEALEGGADSWQLVGPAIDALKAALVEDALQKFSDVNQEIEAALAEPVQEQPVCDECGKSKHDGWALYCVKCVEPMFTSKTEPVEPVAWMNTEDGFCTLDSPVEGIDVMSQWVPLYGSPPQRPAEPVQEPVQDGKCKHCVDGCPACDARKLPVQEPVAWTYEWKHRLHGGSLNVSRARWPESHLWIETPLYAAPPQRKPLTEEEIKACEKQAMVNGALPFEQRVFFARAVERAHGIGGDE